MIVVYGAGAVGLTLAARLTRAGRETLLVTRRQEVAEKIQREGVTVEYPASGEGFRAPVAAVAGIAAAADRIAGDPVLFAMRRPDLEAAAAALVDVAPEAVVASLQNDVDNEERLARRFRHVLGVVVRQTCTRSGPNRVAALAPGRYVVGRHPDGDSAHVQQLVEALRAAEFDVGVSGRIASDKWLKLCVNLMSAPNALIRREDHVTQAFVELKARLLEEARSALAAAGIEASSCDECDRSLDEEIAWQRESLARGTSARPLPVYNAVWAALRAGGPFEAGDYHRRILSLAEARDVPAPTNRRVLACLERAIHSGLGPESLGAEEMLGDVG